MGRSFRNNNEGENAAIKEISTPSLFHGLRVNDINTKKFTGELDIQDTPQATMTVQEETVQIPEQEDNEDENDKDNDGKRDDKKEVATTDDQEVRPAEDEAQEDGVDQAEAEAVHPMMEMWTTNRLT